MAVAPSNHSSGSSNATVDCQPHHGTVDRHGATTDIDQYLELNPGAHLPMSSITYNIRNSIKQLKQICIQDIAFTQEQENDVTNDIASKIPDIRLDTCPDTFIIDPSIEEVQDEADVNKRDLSFIWKSKKLCNTENESTLEPGQDVERDLVEHAPEGSRPELFENEYFKVTGSETAGLGAVAKQPLKYGDVILREKPLLVSDGQDVFAEFAKLTLYQKNIALSLHANEKLKPGTPKIYAIWTTNRYVSTFQVPLSKPAISTFKLGGNHGQYGTSINMYCLALNIRIVSYKTSFAITDTKAGLFPVASRFNHACHPSHSVEFRFNDSTGCLILSVRAGSIAAGKELTVSYGIGRTPEVLYQWYGFRCCCGTCKGLSEEYDTAITSRW